MFNEILSEAFERLCYIIMIAEIAVIFVLRSVPIS